MESYKHVFDTALRESQEHPDYAKYFPTFRDHPELFHFIMAGKAHMSPDREALQYARKLDPEFYGDMIIKGPSRLGGGPDNVDCVESRHILMMAYLQAQIGTDWGNVVEIGGGYGNCLRLVNDLVAFKSWTIIDLPYISDLQEWFLINSGVDITKVLFLFEDQKARQAALTPTLVLGTHSLSEFSIEDFVAYFELIKRSQWFFYVSHNHNPSRELLAKKKELILSHFELYGNMKYEGGSSTMYLFKA